MKKETDSIVEAIAATLPTQPNFKEDFDKLPPIEKVNFMQAVLTDKGLFEKFAIASGVRVKSPTIDLTGLVPDLVLKGGVDNHDEIVAKHNERVEEYNRQQLEAQLAYEEKYRAQFDMNREITRQVLTPLMTNFFKDIKALLAPPPKVSFWTKVKSFFKRNAS